MPVANGGTGQVDGTVAKLHTARSINGIPFDGSSGVQFFGECTTAAGTRLKTVSIPNFTLDSVVTHPIIAVKFNEINTISSPALNVNGTGDFSIMYPTLQSLANVQGAFTSQPNQVVFMYLSTHVSSYSSQTYNVWVIITDPVPYKVVLRGAVIGTSDLPDPAFYPQYTINTEFDQSYAYQATGVSAKDRSDYDPETNIADLNNFTEPGCYYLRYQKTSTGYWDHRPANMDIDIGAFLIIFTTTDNVVVQTIMPRASGKFWRRGFYTSWSKWQFFEGTTIEYNE